MQTADFLSSGGLEEQYRRRLSGNRLLSIPCNRPCTRSAVSSTEVLKGGSASWCWPTLPCMFATSIRRVSHRTSLSALWDREWREAIGSFQLLCDACVQSKRTEIPACKVRKGMDLCSEAGTVMAQTLRGFRILFRRIVLSVSAERNILRRSMSRLVNTLEGAAGNRGSMRSCSPETVRKSESGQTVQYHVSKSTSFASS